MLAAKTTAKERWLQIVGEGSRRSPTFMASMDRDLTRDQLTTMAAAEVMPILPKGYIERFYPGSPDMLWDYASFVRDRRGLEAEAKRQGYDLVDEPVC